MRLARWLAARSPCRARPWRPPRSRRARTKLAPPVPSLLVEILPDRAHGDGAVRDGGGDASGRSVADVAGREHAGQAGLEGVGSPGQPPRPLAGGVADDIRTGED